MLTGVPCCCQSLCVRISLSDYLIPTKGGTNDKNDKRGSCVLAYWRRRCGLGYMAICRDCHQLTPIVWPVLLSASHRRVLMAGRYHLALTQTTLSGPRCGLCPLKGGLTIQGLRSKPAARQIIEIKELAGPSVSVSISNDPRPATISCLMRRTRSVMAVAGQLVATEYSHHHQGGGHQDHICSAVLHNGRSSHRRRRRCNRLAID